MRTMRATVVALVLLCCASPAGVAAAADNAHAAEAAAVAASRCPAGCTAHGNCNAAQRVCDCPVGRTGAACETDTLAPCTLAPGFHTGCSPGRFTSCACAMACAAAMRRNPERPSLSVLCLLAQPPVQADAATLDAYLQSEQGWPKYTDTAEMSRLTWRVVPAAACPQACSGRGVCLNETGHREPACRCAPGFEGAACEHATERPPPCLNDCSGRGVCSNHTGWCACQPGFWGLDCALSMDAAGAVRLWGSAQAGHPPHVQRPAVYVYHLPPLLGAYFASHYVDRPNEEMLLERLSSSEHRVADPADADFFFVPIPVRKLGDEGNCYTIVRDALAFIAAEYPQQWNASRARHMLVGTSDSDPVSCIGEDRLGNETDSRLVWLVHHGTATTPPHFKRGKDVVLPPNNLVDIHRSPLLPLTRGLPPLRRPPERNITLFWAGTIYRPPAGEPPDAAWNVRRTMYDMHRNTTGFVLRDTHTEGAHPDYAETFTRSRFCLAPAGQGGGWGRRATLAALYGCVPLVMQDDTEDALGELIDWRAFSITLPAADVARVPAVLAAVTDERYREMQRQLACAAPRWLYSSVVGASAGEDGADDAVASLLDLLWLRLRRENATASGDADQLGPLPPCELAQRRRCAHGPALPPTFGVPPEWRGDAPPLRHRGLPAGWPAGGAACADKAPDDRPCALPPVCAAQGDANATAPLNGTEPGAEV
jgi:hypothetical protein